MKRTLIFVLLGPPLGFAVSSIRVARRAFSAKPRSSRHTPWAYVVGGVPAAVASAVDYSVSSKTPWVRLALTTIGGYVATVLFIVIAIRPSTSSLWQVLGFGFVGAIPAAVCSWLASEKK